MCFTRSGELGLQISDKQTVETSLLFQPISAEKFEAKPSFLNLFSFKNEKV